LSYWFQTRWFLCEFAIGSYVKLSSAVQVVFFKGLGAIRAKIGSTSDVDKIFSKMYSQYVLFINKCEFLIGSYVKLSSAVGPILVEGPNTFLEENHPMTISSKFSSY
jgi:hypothetical protein